MIGKRGRETAKVQLSSRFLEAVGRVVMCAGRDTSTAYLADWQRSLPRLCGEDTQAEVTLEAVRLEALYRDERLEQLVRSKGLEPSSQNASSRLDPSEA